MTTTNRYDELSEAEIWDRLVGHISPREFLADVSHEAAVRDYIEHSPMCADLSADERRTASDALMAYVRRHSPRPGA